MIDPSLLQRLLESQFRRFLRAEVAFKPRQAGLGLVISVERQAQIEQPNLLLLAVVEQSIY